MMELILDLEVDGAPGRDEEIAIEI